MGIPDQPAWQAAPPLLGSLRRDEASSSLSKPRDGWDALRPQFANPLTVPPFPSGADDVEAVARAVRSVPAVPDNTRLRHVGPLPVGIPIELPPEISDAQADAMLAHVWVLLYKRIVQDAKLPVILAGRWGLLGSEQAAFMVWLSAGPGRLVVIPVLRRYAGKVTVGLGHCYLHHQGWMTAHDPNDDAHWADLSNNYESYFQMEGSAYYEYKVAFEDGAIYWHRVKTWMDKVLGALGGGRLGWGGGELIFTSELCPGNQVFYSRKLGSFFHFAVGEGVVPQGSQPGMVLAHITTLIAKMTMELANGTRGEEDLRVQMPGRNGVGETIREAE